MSLYYLEIINITKQNLRNGLVKALDDNLEFKRLINLIFYKKNYRFKLKTLFDTFNYFDVKLSYGDDLFSKVPELKNYCYGYGRTRALTQLKNTNVTKILIYLFSQQTLNKHNLFTYLRELFLKCDEIEFKWVVKIICDKEGVKKMLEGGT